MGQLVPGRDAPERLRVQRVEADVHTVQPCRQQGGQLFGQPHAVGGHGDLADAGGGFQPGHQLLHPRAHQRFAAGHAHGVHAAPGKQRRQPQKFFIGQNVPVGKLWHALRHTVAAAQAAQVGDGQAQVVDVAAVCVKHSRPRPGRSARSCRRSFPLSLSRPAPCPCPRLCTYRRW